MKGVMALIICLMSLAVALAFSRDQVPNLQQPRYGLFTAGQPTAVGFDQLAAMGFNTVINVLPEKECEPGEPSVVTSHNMAYYNLPFEPEGLSKETIVQFADLLATVDKPILVHCSTGNHVGGMWLAYRVMIENAALPQAVNEARLIGMKPAMEIAVLDWLANQGYQARR